MPPWRPRQRQGAGFASQGLLQGNFGSPRTTGTTEQRRSVIQAVLPWEAGSVLGLENWLAGRLLVFFMRPRSRRDRSDMARQARKGKQANKKKPRTAKSDYFTQPGKRGAVIVLRKPIGNRATAKVCGVMPTRVHAKMLINQLERAESVVKDLFLEATD